VPFTQHLFAAESLLTPTTYGLQVDSILLDLDAGDYDIAQQKIEQLHQRQVAWPGGHYPTDGTLLDLVKKKKYGILRERIRAIRNYLTHWEPDTELTSKQAVEQASLEKIRLREAAAGAKLQRGGSTGENPLALEHLPISISERLEAAFTWIGETLVEFLRWVRDLFFKKNSTDGENDTSTLVAFVWIMIGIIVVVGVLLAITAWRNKMPATVVPTLTKQPTIKDADPRSRAADDWIAYATELFRAGRHREAIRAWYHAMLMSCWSYGILHHRVGRTNWEYAMSLSSTIAWRGRFQDLTHRFDLAWYGGRIGVDEAHAYAIEAEQLLLELKSSGREP
jgi:hypothetical protein